MNIEQMSKQQAICNHEDAHKEYEVGGYLSSSYDTVDVHYYVIVCDYCDLVLNADVDIEQEINECED